MLLRLSMSISKPIIIADDHPMVRSALAYTLRATISDADLLEVATQSALEQTLIDHPDAALILLDLCIPGARGFSALLQLRAVHPEIPVAVVSAHDHPRNIQRSRLFGANGFIPKTAAMPQMQEALRAIHAGGYWFPPTTEDALCPGDLDMAARMADLTAQQLRVLKGLSEGLLNKQIAYDLDVAENTIKVHVSAILRKLSVNSRTHAALIARDLAEAGDELGALD
jgi:DNA-binding NarL/FixJ family response regulator